MDKLPLRTLKKGLILLPSCPLISGCCNPFQHDRVWHICRNPAAHNAVDIKSGLCLALVYLDPKIVQGIRCDRDA
jgi:hypothetical protein